MKHHNSQRILTTHVGSLPRLKDILDLMKAKVTGTGTAPDRQLYEGRIRSAVAECVRKQAECGIDILNDGELSKPGFFTYVRERLEGFEPRPTHRMQSWPLEVSAFPEYYEQYFKEAMGGGAMYQSFRWSVPDPSGIAAPRRSNVTSKTSKLPLPRSTLMPYSCRR
jgi:5-methyltetrahydropteroyltriglutamate--homocysteine methyltransferase